MVSEETEGETGCLVSFKGPDTFSMYSHTVDHWDKHHLARAGLEPFALYEIVDSDLPVAGRHHYAIVFRDRMFECIAEGVLSRVRSECFGADSHSQKRMTTRPGRES